MKQVLSRLRSLNSLSEQQQWILDLNALHRAFHNKIIILQHSMLYRNEYELSEEFATIADSVVMLREHLINQKRSTRSWFVSWAYLNLRSKQTFMSQNIYNTAALWLNSHWITDNFFKKSRESIKKQSALNKRVKRKFAKQHYSSFLMLVMFIFTSILLFKETRHCQQRMTLSMLMTRYVLIEFLHETIFLHCRRSSEKIFNDQTSCINDTSRHYTSWKSLKRLFIREWWVLS